MLSKLGCACLLLTLAVAPVQGNENKNHIIALNWISPIIGLYDVTYETKVARQYSCFIRGIYYNISNPTILDIDSDNVRFTAGDDSTTSPDTFWILASTSGLNFWINDALTGLYVGAELLAGVSYLNGSVRSGALGVVGKVGYRWIWNRITLGPYFGVVTDFTGVGPYGGLSLGIAF